MTITRSNDEHLPCSVYLVALVLVFAFGFCVSYFSATMEARAFERITGKKVSAWDAMFIELRVDESTQDAKEGD